MPNSITTLSGRAQSGKTALLMTLAGITPPASGSLTLFDNDPNSCSRKAWLQLRQQIGYVLPNTALISHLSVLKNITLPLNYHQVCTPAEAEERARALLAWLDCHLDVNQLPHTLSEADKRRVSIARALILSPSLLFIDEAFNHLDFHAAQSQLTLYQKLRQERGVTLVLATQDLFITLSCADTHLVLTSDKILTFHSGHALQTSQHPLLVAERAARQRLLS